MQESRRLARRRSEARSRSEKEIPDSPDWIILDMDYLSQAQEKEILAELGLTVDQALGLR